MLRNRVRELRARFQFTQTDLAKRIGVTRQTIGFIEKGEFSPSVLLALKIAEQFECKVEEVFWIQEEEK